MADAPLLPHTVEDGIAVVTLNRPEALNSINRALRMEIMELFPALDMRKDVKVIVITGAGDKAFCTGADLKERSTRSTEEMVYDRHYLTSKSTSIISSVTKPVIAAIKGYCMAGGYEMVLQCDISICSDNAIFALPEVTHGFFPGGGACQRLPRLVGYQMARELIFTGRRWDAKEAKELGLVNKVVPLDKVMDEAMAMARKIASYPSVGVIQAKRALNQSMEVGLTAGLRFDVEAWVGCMHSDEWKEKLGGFVRKERKS
ncbi:MAG TPA: enoyl-CoA hydratase/isomerase family protein [Burkholderiales bacterium]|nr:enoyl-CoA hydratase/isomerase family protein [Burkholderiales bacterium]